MKVFWSNQAKRDYFKVLDYLYKNWGSKEVERFIDSTEKLVRIIQNKPETFVQSAKRKRIRKGLITKHNSIFYRVKPLKKEITILAIWDNRQDPGKSKY